MCWVWRAEVGMMQAAYLSPPYALRYHSPYPLVVITIIIKTIINTVIIIITMIITIIILIIKSIASLCAEKPIFLLLIIILINLGLFSLLSICLLHIYNIHGMVIGPRDLTNLAQICNANANAPIKICT